MNHLQFLFRSPEYYPIAIDRDRGVVRFVRMSPESYRESIFLDSRTMCLGGQTYEIRIDDVQLAALVSPVSERRLHYIFHTAFCCSTLLARYFETLEDCLVLKEPVLLTQIAVDLEDSPGEPDELLPLVLRLLTRVYGSSDRVVIKTHEPCNSLARHLLEENLAATATFIITPLRQFVLSVLKSSFRRSWVRTRIPAAARAACCYPLMSLTSDSMSDGQAAACLWLVSRFVCGELSRELNPDRFRVIEGDDLAWHPAESLPFVMEGCSLRPDRNELKQMLTGAATERYSKDLSRTYGPESRQRELAALEADWGHEADQAIAWAASTGMEDTLSNLPLRLSDRIAQERAATGKIQIHASQGFPR